MTGLRDQFEGVNRDSLAGQGKDNDSLEEVTKEELESAESTELETDKGESEGDDSEGRTIENVYGELSRKQEKADERQQAFQEQMINQMGQLVRDVTASRNDPPAGQQGPKAIGDYSVIELQAIQKDMAADDPQRAQIDALISDKVVDDKVRRQVQEITGQERTQAQREVVVLQAVERYPDLDNENSSFYQKVDQKIRALDPNYVARNPRAIMDVANEVAIAEGINPKQARTIMRVPGRSGATKADGGRPAPKDEVESTMSEAEAIRIGKRLKGALGRDFTKEQIKTIREDHSDYDTYWSRSTTKRPTK